VGGLERFSHFYLIEDRNSIVDEEKEDIIVYRCG